MVNDKDYRTLKNAIEILSNRIYQLESDVKKERLDLDKLHELQLSIHEVDERVDKVSKDIKNFSDYFEDETNQVFQEYESVKKMIERTDFLVSQNSKEIRKLNEPNKSILKNIWDNIKPAYFVK